MSTTAISLAPASTAAAKIRSRKLEVGARAVDAEVADPHARVDGVRDRADDALDHLLARHPVGGELPVADRRLDHGRAHARLEQRLDVGGHGARETPDLGAQPGADDQPQRLGVLGRDAREARLDPVDAERVERRRDLELRLRVEHDADRLLAVAQRRVVEADPAGASGAGVIAAALRSPSQSFERSIMRASDRRDSARASRCRTR